MKAFGGARMASKRNQVVAEIVSAVLGDLSPEQASIRLDYQVGREGIRALKNGKIGWERTVRTFAEGFWERIYELYGDEIAQVLKPGDPSPDRAAAWLALKAGFVSEEAQGTSSVVPEIAELASQVADEISRRNGEALERRTTEAALAAQGAKFDPEFGAALQCVTEGYTLEQFAKRVRCPVELVAAAYRGWVLPQETLVDWIAQLGLSSGQADTLLRAAGYGPWDPVAYLRKAFARVAREYGLPPVELVLPPNWDPDRIKPWLVISFGSAFMVPDEAYGNEPGHVRIILPPDPESTHWAIDWVSESEPRPVEYQSLQPDAEGQSGALILDAGLYRLSQRVGEVVPRSGGTPREQLTPDQARAELADVEAELRERGRLRD